MPTSREFLEKADECERLASEAKTETDRLACLDLARTFLDAAAQQTPQKNAETRGFDTLKAKLETGPAKAWGWRKQLMRVFR